MEHFDAIAAQRLALADVLDGLDADQWATTSLCDGWTVQHVVGHLLVPFEVPTRRVALEMLRAGGRFSKANSTLAERAAAAAPPSELVARLRAHADDRFTPPALGSDASLTDLYVHTYDICLPLGVVPPGDSAQWPVVLQFLTSRKARIGFLRHRVPEVSLVATDVEWSSGDGPRVSGPAAALSLTLLGRNALLDQLEGPGLTTLTSTVLDSGSGRGS